MTIEAILIWLLIGAIAGWLAGIIVKGYGFGIVGNIVVGIIGAVLGGWLLGILGLGTYGIVGTIVSATIGAVVLLLLLRFLRKAGAT